MFSWDLMVLSKSSYFFGVEVEGWPVEATAGSDSRMVFGTILFIFPSCDAIFFLEGTSQR